MLEGGEKTQRRRELFILIILVIPEVKFARVTSRGQVRTEVGGVMEGGT